MKTHSQSSGSSTGQLLRTNGRKVSIHMCPAPHLSATFRIRVQRRSRAENSHSECLESPCPGERSASGAFGDELRAAESRRDPVHCSRGGGRQGGRRRRGGGPKVIRGKERKLLTNVKLFEKNSFTLKSLFSPTSFNQWSRFWAEFSFYSHIKSLTDCPWK